MIAAYYNEIHKGRRMTRRIIINRSIRILMEWLVRYRDRYKSDEWRRRARAWRR